MNRENKWWFYVVGIRVCALVIVAFLLAVTYAFGVMTWMGRDNPATLRRILHYTNPIMLNANARDDFGRTGLMAAAMNGEIEWLKAFLDHGNDNNKANVNLKAEIPAKITDDDNGNTALIYAIKYQLINQQITGPNINQEMVDLLLRYGADPNIPNSKGQYPIHFIEPYNDPKVLQSILKSLIDARADINAQDAAGNTIIHLLVNKRNVDVLREVFIKYVDLINFNVANKDGMTPEMIAHEPDKSDILDAFKLLPSLRLVGANGRVNERDIEGRDGLMLGIMRNDMNFVQDQVVNSDINAQDSKGNTPLMFAIYNRQRPLDYLRLLLDYKADPRIANNDGNTPLHLVVHLVSLAQGADARVQAARMLIESKYDRPDIFARNKQGYTPLDMAVLAGDIDLIKYLSGIVGDVRGSAINLARQSGNNKALEILE